MINKNSIIQNTPLNIDTSTPVWINRTPSFPDRVVKVATLFSGIGAPEHAFVRLGIKTDIKFACDINEFCKKTYFANHDITLERWYDDVTMIDATMYHDDVDILIGGAPCQAFSQAGDRLGFEDPRGVLFLEFARVVNECKPKVFIFENVRGMMTHERGKTWNAVRHTFQNECDYKIFFQVLDAKHYGVPQTRRRLFVIGFRDDLDFKYPHPVNLVHSVFDYLQDRTDSKFYIPDQNVKFITRSRERLDAALNGTLDVSREDNLLPNEFSFPLMKIDNKYYMSDKMMKYIMKENFGKPTLDMKIAKTLTRTMTKMHKASIDNYYTDDKGTRRITPRESLRLMGFRDSFKIVVSDSNIFMQAGNSMVVDCIMALLQQLDITRFSDEN